MSIEGLPTDPEPLRAHRLFLASVNLAILPVYIVPTWLALYFSRIVADSWDIEQYAPILLQPLFWLPGIVLMWRSAPAPRSWQRRLLITLCAVPILSQLFALFNLAHPMRAPLWEDTQTKALLVMIIASHLTTALLYVAAFSFLRRLARQHPNFRPPTATLLFVCAALSFLLAFGTLASLSIFLNDLTRGESPSLLWHFAAPLHRLFPWALAAQIALSTLIWLPIALHVRKCVSTSR